MLGVVAAPSSSKRPRVVGEQKVPKEGSSIGRINGLHSDGGFLRLKSSKLQILLVSLALRSVLLDPARRPS
jgi:hypothetical protein